jgi:predicted ATPase/class 3 adenylate cyclase
MSNRSETFGRLLKGAINSIAAYEGKTAPAIEDELGAQIGVAGSTIQRYKAGSLPTEPRVVQILSEAAVRRGYLSRAWLLRFLQAARYANPDVLLAQLADVLGPTGTPHDTALPSGMLAFLFTDIEGSTTLWEQHGSAMERALARHDAIMRQTLDAYGGQVFNTAGDAFHAVFTTVAEALDAALASQRALAAEAWGPIEPIRVRAALHVGTAQQRDGDYYGPPLNRVARLCAAGHGGQVLLSNAAQELVRDTLPKGAALRDLGEHRLKDLARPERIFQVVVPDLTSDFPPLRTLDSYTHNLPAQPTPLIGREAEVRDVSERMRRENIRLLTLTGPGGIGKTRVALQAAADLLDDFRDGVYFVPLAPIRDPEVVTVAIAQALGVKEQGDRLLVEQIKAYLRQKRILLLLDNFEQVAAAGSLVAELLAAAPELKVMISSREVLHLYGEHEYSVPPLSVPDMRNLPPIERLTQYEAVRLFIERAQAVRPDFTITSENAPAVAEICTRLDGLPLGIELAAARSKLFPPKALLARLDKRLALLTTGARDLPARQQTLRSAITWSYDLLDPAEQAIFTRLGVFAGGCTLEAVEAVLADDQGGGEGELSVYVPASTLLDGLTSLIDKSLLKQQDGLGGASRFVMLETIHEYALERLKDSGEYGALHNRHVAYFLMLAEAAEPYFRSAMQVEWADRLECEHDNFRAALAYCVTPGELRFETADQDTSRKPQTSRLTEIGLRLAGALFWFWHRRNYLTEGRRWLDEALMRANGLGRTAARANALFGAGTLASVQGDLVTTRSRVEESVAIWREVGDKRGLALSLSYDRGLGWIALYERRVAEARALFEEGVTLWRELGDKWGLAFALWGLGAAVWRDDLSTARPIVEESVALFRALGDRKGLAHALFQLGILAGMEANYTRASALYQEALAVGRELGDKELIVQGLGSSGGVAEAQGDYTRAMALYQEGLALAWPLDMKDTVPHFVISLAGIAGAFKQAERAARLLSAGESLLNTIGLSVSVWPQFRADYDRHVAAARAQLDDATFAEAWAVGQALTWEQAVDEALAISGASE